LWDTRVGPAGNGCCIGSPESPAFANGVVYTGGGDGRLHAFDAATGASRRSAFVGSELAGSPVISRGRVYVSSVDGSAAFGLP
jgi:outer membrane protein assembly factor BamB